MELLDLQVASGPKDFGERHLRALSTTLPEVLRSQLRSGGATTGSEDRKDDADQIAHYTSHVNYCKDVLYIPRSIRGESVWPSSHLFQKSRRCPRKTRSAGRCSRRTSKPDIDCGRGLPMVTRSEKATMPCRTTPRRSSTPAVSGSPRRSGARRNRTTAKRLRDAAVAVDRARGKMRHTNPDDALAIWKALVRGRWSMVDWFDTDGRRFVLAIPNSPDVTDPRGLSERENQVVDYAVLGHSNKMIAYRLGLSTSRVSTLLRSSMRKMGFRTRSQLVKEMGDFQALE